MKTFNITDWMISILLGFTSSSMQIVKAKSMKYEEPARLAVLNYFQPILQLILDIIFFHSDFSFLQALGAGIIFVSNSVSWSIKAKKAFSNKRVGPKSN